ncbi:hypothetical protein EYS14_01580 [Alteromonadaceae bacterium M269]|nr:hypothetical protein EYS14_01580 [Alteromonadaceae bacterium M269]
MSLKPSYLVNVPLVNAINKEIRRQAPHLKFDSSLEAKIFEAANLVVDECNLKLKRDTLGDLPVEDKGFSREEMLLDIDNSNGERPLLITYSAGNAMNGGTFKITKQDNDVNCTLIIQDRVVELVRLFPSDITAISGGYQLTQYCRYDSESKIFMVNINILDGKDYQDRSFFFCFVEVNPNDLQPLPGSEAIRFQGGGRD